VERTSSDANYESIAVDELLRRTARRLPDKVALIDGERRLTFREMDRQADSVAAGLAGLGVIKGDRVALFCPNCIEFEVAFFGILRAGAVATTVSSAYKARELAHQIQDSSAKVLIVHQALMDVVDDPLPDMEGVDHIVVIGDGGTGVSFAELASTNSVPPSVDLDPREDLAALPYSSGTTGLPKGVMLTHFNLTSNLAQLDRMAPPIMDEDDVPLVHLPLFHVFGLNVLMNWAVAVGATQVLMSRFDMIDFLDLVEEHKVTLLITVPPVIQGLAAHPEVPRRDLSSVRFSLAGAAPMSAELQLKASAAAGFPVGQGYGMTELSPVTNIDDSNPDLIRHGAVGRAIPGTEMKVVDPETGHDLPSGDPGELIVRGPQVMKGYWNAPEATAETIKDGWLHTGDIARMDEDGYVYIVDRKKELIKYKGFQVAPAELEGLLTEHPSISDAAVIGIPDEEAGEVPKAFVVATGAVTADEVKEFVSERVASYKRLAEVEFVDAIPKSSSGKILRRLLS
jgi:acyl-CoA synthetase (AMP-forming)/AMP-acid ligase II